MVEGGGGGGVVTCVIAVRVHAPEFSFVVVEPNAATVGVPPHGY